jgi:hypothetical protein
MSHYFSILRQLILQLTSIRKKFTCDHGSSGVR